MPESVNDEEAEAMENAAPEPEQSAAAAEPEPEQQAAEPEPEQQAAEPEPEQQATDTEPEPEQPQAEAEPEQAPVESEAAPAAPEEDAIAEEVTAPSPPAEEPGPPKPADLSAEARYSATGKRKSSVARVILQAGKGGFELNGRPLDNYFPRRTLQEVVRQPLKVTGYLDRVDVRARIHGGGISSQADAVRHGIAKALIEADPHLRGELKRRQLLTRDPRVKERKKAGLKKARKRPQFSKR
jgi:small subunit ribosomal protein S9